MQEGKWVKCSLPAQVVSSYELESFIPDYIPFVHE